jgi:hypothetical protein
VGAGAGAGTTTGVGGGVTGCGAGVGSTIGSGFGAAIKGLSDLTEVLFDELLACTLGTFLGGPVALPIAPNTNNPPRTANIFLPFPHPCIKSPYA